MTELMPAIANLINALAFLIKVLSFPLMLWVLLRALRT